MSTSVKLENLSDAIARYGFAYVITAGDQGPPHAVQSSVVLQDGKLLVSGIGNRTRNNAQARPTVGLLWPPQSAADYSLIVDGEAKVVGDSLRITPTRAVLHRPGDASAPQPGSCGADCIELKLPR